MVRREAIWPALGAVLLYAVNAPSLTVETLQVRVPDLAILSAVVVLSVLLTTGWVTRRGRCLSRGGLGQAKTD